MKIVRTVAALQEALGHPDNNGISVGLVPTMGALHQGHLSLVNRARSENDLVVVSDFVNPTQFNNPADLETYPRTFDADAAMLEAAGVDIMFAPSVEEMYPEGRDTRVFDLSPVADVMEGPSRPGHFNGVAQVVSKLFAFVNPTRAYFGEKDFQQIAVIRKMVEQIPQKPEIVACPICRADDGLALSSRNSRLNPEQRAAAPGIFRALSDSLALKGLSTPAQVEEKVTAAVNAIPGMQVEYFTIVDAETLAPAADWSRPAVGCITVNVGDVRLIDNIKY